MSSQASHRIFRVVLLLAYGAVPLAAVEQPPRESLDLPPRSKASAVKPGNPLLDSSLNRLLRNEPTALGGGDDPGLPGATLTLASPSSATDMAAQIVALAAAGRDIISSSIGYYNAEPGDGSGSVADALTTVYNTYGTLYVQAAGNQANYHWDRGLVDMDGDDLPAERAAGEVEP